MTETAIQAGSQWDDEGRLIQVGAAPDSADIQTDKKLAKIQLPLDTPGIGLLDNSVLSILASLQALLGAEHQRLRPSSEALRPITTPTSYDDDADEGTPEENTTDSEPPAGLSRALSDRRAILKGPARGKALVTGINAKTSTYFADLADSGLTTLTESLDAQQQLQAAINGCLVVRDNDQNRYVAVSRLDSPQLIVGIRGMSTRESQLRLHGKQALAVIVDLGLFAYHNGEELRHSGLSVCAGIRDIQTPAEARWYVKLAEAVEKKVGLGVGTLRLSLHADTTQAVAALPKIAKALGSRLAGIHLDTDRIATQLLVQDSAWAYGATLGSAPGETWTALASRVSAVAHDLGVPATADMVDESTCAQLLKDAGLDGFLVSSLEEAALALESAEDAFDGSNQISRQLKIEEVEFEGDGGTTSNTQNQTQIIEEAYASTIALQSGAPLSSSGVDSRVAAIAYATRNGHAEYSDIRTQLRTLTGGHENQSMARTAAAIVRRAVHPSKPPVSLSSAAQQILSPA